MLLRCSLVCREAGGAPVGYGARHEIHSSGCNREHDHSPVVVLEHWLGFVLVQQPSGKSLSRGDLSCLVKIGF
jgi:hypothetical protein